MKSARVNAQWSDPEDTTLYLDHVEVRPDDLDWMRRARRLKLWAVKVPAGFLADLTALEWLEIEGGSGASLDVLTGCKQIRYLRLNQILGLEDLDAVGDLGNALECLHIYGQPRVKALPDLSRLEGLVRVELGSLKGLTGGIAPALRAPAIEELILAKVVVLADTDPELVRTHATLRRFNWFLEDVPRRLYEPMLLATQDMQKADWTYHASWFGDW